MPTFAHSGNADSSALNSERVKQAVQEHRVDHHPNIRVLKRHVGLGKKSAGGGLTRAYPVKPRRDR
jgi:hypothetical protein